MELKDVNEFIKTLENIALGVEAATGVDYYGANYEFEKDKILFRLEFNSMGCSDNDSFELLIDDIVNKSVKKNVHTALQELK